MKHRFVENVLPPAATFVLTTAAAEFGIRAAGISPLLLPTPSAVGRAALQHSSTLLPALARTAQAVVVGLALSIAVGLLVAIALSTSRCRSNCKDALRRSDATRRNARSRGSGSPTLRGVIRRSSRAGCGCASLWRARS